MFILPLYLDMTKKVIVICDKQNNNFCLLPHFAYLVKNYENQANQYCACSNKLVHCAGMLALKNIKSIIKCCASN